MKVLKSNRNQGKFFHKVPKGINASLAKSYAAKDITEYVSNNSDFGDRNYVNIESIVLLSIKNNQPFINFNSLSVS